MPKPTSRKLQEIEADAFRLPFTDKDWDQGKFSRERLLDLLLAACFEIFIFAQHAVCCYQPHTGFGAAGQLVVLERSNLNPREPQTWAA